MMNIKKLYLRINKISN